MEDSWWVALIGTIAWSVLTVVWPIFCRANGGRRIYTTIETAVAIPATLAWVCVLAQDRATAIQLDDWTIPAGGCPVVLLFLLMLVEVVAPQVFVALSWMIGRISYRRDSVDEIVRHPMKRCEVSFQAAARAPRIL